MDIQIDKKNLYNSLNNALENGYELLEWTAEEIAEDLNQYDQYFENIPHKLLIEPIQEWLDNRDLRR